MAISLKRATATVDLCTDADLYAEWESLTSKMAENRKTGVTDDRLTGDPDARRIVEIQDLMKDSTLTFTIQALPKKVWAELEDAHKPREGDEQDEAYGVNIDTFVDAAYSLPSTVLKVENKVTGEVVPFVNTDWPALSEQLSDGQWTAFMTKLFVLNRAAVTSPFSPAASRAIQSSDDN